MKKLMILFWTGMTFMLPALEIKPADGEFVREIGDKVSFRIVLGKERANAKFKVLVKADRYLSGEHQLAADLNGEAVIDLFPTRPGFIFVEAVDLNKRAVCSIAVTPELLRPGRRMPKSFNRYWNKVRRELDLHPVQYEISELSGAKSGFKAYDVRIQMPDRMQNVYAILTMPLDAIPGRVPAMVMFYGFGVDKVSPVYRKNMMILTVNPVPVKNEGKMGETFLENGQFFNRMYSGMADIKENIFAGMFARAFRAVQFIKTMPEWDQRTLITYGTRVGGAQAVAAAGFDPQVSMCAAFAPALCNHGGYDNGGESGWPQYHLDTEVYPEQTDKVLGVVDHVDICFFGMRIRNATVYMTAGYLDQQCLPSSVTALYNVIRSENKTLRAEPELDHRIPTKFYREASALIDAHVLERQEDLL